LHIQAFFDKGTATITYVVSDPATRCCAIIDPVLDFDPQTGMTSTKSADLVIDYIEKSRLIVMWFLETHIHADHLTAAHYLQERCGGEIGISEKIVDVLKHWVPVFNTEDDTPVDGSQFDHLFKDEETFSVGSLTVKVMHTPGHTPACASYLIEDAIFVGDTLFMPYGGTSRADFPGGDAATLYRSIRKILSLPDETKIFTCHDYPPEGHNPAWESTVGEQKKRNIMIREDVTEGQYIEARTKRDSTLPAPRLLLPSIQVNLRAGDLGKMEDNGRTQYLKIPLKVA
jgi:glyoxylase-like metal-dependent hydrolase (beta-lactamase superfamily II)